jgi:hypothetical protein
VTGKRRSRVKFKKELAVVTEFNEKKMDALIDSSSPCVSPVAAVMTDTFWASIEEYSSPVGIMSSLFDFESQSSWEESVLSGLDTPSMLSFASNPSLLLMKNQKRIQSYSVPRGKRRDPPSII